MKPQIQYLGKKITIKSLRDYILENKLREIDTILLHPSNFDDIVIEYLDTYNSSIQLPYFLIGVLIGEDMENSIPKNRVGTVKNDQDPNRR